MTTPVHDLSAFSRAKLSGAEGLLYGLCAIDLGTGLVSALIAKFLSENGVHVVRRLSAERDPFSEVHPAYDVLRNAAGAAGVLCDRVLEENLAVADLCIVGGEAFPGSPAARDAKALARRYPQLIVLELTGDCREGSPDLPAVDILAQARSGLNFEFRDAEPTLMAAEPASFGAMLQAVAGLGAALIERERTGMGQVVQVSFLEGALSWLQCVWAKAERPSKRFGLMPPRAARPLILRCRDDVYVHVVLGSLGSKARLYKVLGIDDPTIDANDSGTPKIEEGPAKFYGDLDLLAPYSAARDSEELLAALRAADIVVEPVLAPGACWDDPQVRSNNVIAEAHDGSAYVGNPFSYAPSSGGSPSPMVGRASVLEGISVVDFGAFVAGPLASVTLADLGADVVKIEPLEGDALRGVPRYFASANRGKRSICVDLKSPRGLNIAHELCRRSDVVCNNFRSGATKRLGIDAASLHATNPALILLNSVGYGASGPKARNPAFDPAIQAFTGIEVVAGGAGNDPVHNRLVVVDYAAGMMGAAAVLLALHRRARRGGGADIVLPLANVGIFLLSQLVRRPDGSFTGVEPIDSERRGRHPAEKIYRTADGWIAIAARDDAMAERLVAALGLKGDISARRAHWSRSEADAIAAALRRLPMAEILNSLRASNVWCERCNDTQGCDILDDRALQALGAIYNAEDAQLGKVLGLGQLFGLQSRARRPQGITPQKGEHTDEILRELGHNEAEIAALREQRAVS